jgi:hypothetical protein
MRLATLATIFILAACACASAQGGAAGDATAPGVVAVKFRWSKERIGWERDPFAGPVENFDQMRVRARNEKRIDDLKRGGNQAEVNRAQREARADAAIIDRMRGDDRPPRYAFLYKATFRNDGAKAVSSLDWDYVFIDAATGEELGRREFTSDGRLSPGKSREFDFFVPQPPAQRISAHALDRRERDGMAERVAIVRVVYEDGTVWEPAAPARPAPAAPPAP